MPRRKKAAKRTIEARPSLQKMAREWLNAPSKLASVAKKGLSKLQKETKKQEKAAKNLALRIKKQALRLMSPLDARTSLAKKRAKLAQKAHQQDVVLLSRLQKQLAEYTDEEAQLAAQHSKFVALDKQLAQFEKEWQRNEGKGKKAMPTKRNPGRPKKASAPTWEEEYHPTEPEEESSDTDNDDEMI